MKVEDADAFLLSTVDPTISLDGRPVPAMTTMLYRVCDNDPQRFEEATRLVHLFIAAVIPTIRRAALEEAAGVAETCRLPSREVTGGPMAGWQTFPHEWPSTIAAAIRALDA